MATFQTVPQYGATVTDAAGRTGKALYNPNNGQPLTPPTTNTGSGFGGVGQQLAPSNASITPMGAAPVPGSSSNRSLTGGNLSSDLNQGFSDSPQYQGILDAYDASRGATAANTQATGQYIQNVTGGNTDYEKLQTGTQVQSEMESRRGFATNVAMLTNLQAQGAQRVKQLTDQANNALMANNAEGAKALADLAVQEQTAITDARTQFLTNYFNSQAEVRTQAGFQTPEQSQVLDLAKTYPDAGVVPTDSLASAQAKISRVSPTYQASLAQAQQTALSTAATAASTKSLTQANVGLIGAQAGEAGAGAAAQAAAAEQTRTITGLISGGNADSSNTDQSIVQQLLLNQQDPSKGMTLDQLQNSYASYPGGTGPAIAQRILREAQSQGYNTAGTGLNNARTLTNTQNLGSGGYTGASTALTNILGGFTGGAFGSNPLSPTTPSLNSLATPTKGQITSLNGITYKFDGSNWVASK